MTPLTFNSGLYRLFAMHDSIDETHTATRFLLGLLKDIGIFEFDHLCLYSILALFIKWCLFCFPKKFRLWKSFISKLYCVCSYYMHVRVNTCTVICMNVKDIIEAVSSSFAQFWGLYSGCRVYTADTFTH